MYIYIYYYFLAKKKEENLKIDVFVSGINKGDIWMGVVGPLSTKAMGGHLGLGGSGVGAQAAAGPRNGDPKIVPVCRRGGSSPCRPRFGKPFELLFRARLRGAAGGSGKGVGFHNVSFLPRPGCPRRAGSCSEKPQNRLFRSPGPGGIRSGMRFITHFPPASCCSVCEPQQNGGGETLLSLESPQK